MNRSQIPVEPIHPRMMPSCTLTGRFHQRQCTVESAAATAISVSKVGRALVHTHIWVSVDVIVVHSMMMPKSTLTDHFHQPQCTVEFVAATATSVSKVERALAHTLIWVSVAVVVALSCTGMPIATVVGKTDPCQKKPLMTMVVGCS